MQAVEAATAPASEDHEMGSFGVVDEPAGRNVAYESPVHLHVGRPTAFKNLLKY
jgi:hypothetical protein